MDIQNAVDSMLKFKDAYIGTQEIPDEVSLVIAITNCPFRCKGCKTKDLQEDVGELLTSEMLTILIDSLWGEFTCVCFMGGDIAPDEVNELAAYIRANYPQFKIAWYSGDETITVFTEYSNFDYMKFGAYINKLGGLVSHKTNQRLYKVVDGYKLKDITSLFWKD